MFTILADRAKFPPWGLFGGEDGKCAKYSLISNGVEKPLGSKISVTIRQGEAIRMETCGGGGYGPPGERDPALVLRDVRERKASLDRAKERYGVVIDPQSLSIDYEETGRLRRLLEQKATGG